MNAHALRRMLVIAAACAPAVAVTAPLHARPADVAAARAPYRVTFDSVVRQTWASRATESVSGCRIDVTGGGSRELAFVARRTISLALGPRVGVPRLRLGRVPATLWTRFGTTHFRPRDCVEQPPTHGDPPPPTRRRFANASVQVFASRPGIRARADHPSLPRTVEVCGSAKVPAPRVELARGRVSARRLRRGSVERLVIRARRLLTRQIEVPGLDSCTLQTHVEWTLTFARVLPRR